MHSFVYGRLELRKALASIFVDGAGLEKITKHIREAQGGLRRWPS